MEDDSDETITDLRKRARKRGRAGERGRGFVDPQVKVHQHLQVAALLEGFCPWSSLLYDLSPLT